MTKAKIFKSVFKLSNDKQIARLIVFVFSLVRFILTGVEFTKCVHLNVLQKNN